MMSSMKRAHLFHVLYRYLGGGGDSASVYLGDRDDFQINTWIICKAISFEELYLSSFITLYKHKYYLYIYAFMYVYFSYASCHRYGEIQFMRSEYQTWIGLQ